ncbi:hypothetical protein PALB_28500 [Pseudoalteromonas luteoviolacea B = ATCC 29581]|nr:hypothetical protein PALB_28500 [Pseudoalteromonas luteoviolacea B = ATCC 29581]
MMKYVFLTLGLTMLAGCGSTQNAADTETVQTNEQASSLACDKAVSTGSRFSKKRCKTASNEDNSKL